MLFDYRPKVHPPLIEAYYTPGTPLEGRCLYPFLQARVSFSGKVSSVRSSGSRWAISRPRRSKRSGTARATSTCASGCSTTSSFPSAAAAARWSSHNDYAAGDKDGHPARRSHPSRSPPNPSLLRSMSTLLVNPPPINGIRSPGRAGVRSARKCSARRSRPTRCSSRRAPARARPPFRLIDMTAANLSTRRSSPARRRRFRPDLIVFPTPRRRWTRTWRRWRSCARISARPHLLRTARLDRAGGLDGPRRAGGRAC